MTVQPLQPAAAPNEPDQDPSAHAVLRQRRRGFTPLYRLARRPSALVGLIILIFWALVAITWPAIVPHWPTDFDLLAKFSAPSSAHWLGADNFGRDVLSRVLAGSRSVLFISTSAAVLGVAFGTALGLTAAFYGGLVEEVLMRLMDILMAFPLIIIALLYCYVPTPGSVYVLLSLRCSGRRLPRSSSTMRVASRRTNVRSCVMNIRAPR